MFAVIVSPNDRLHISKLSRLMVWLSDTGGRVETHSQLGTISGESCQFSSGGDAVRWSWCWAATRSHVQLIISVFETTSIRKDRD